MMGELKTKMEEQLQPVEDGMLQKEPTIKEEYKEGGIMEESKIKEEEEEEEQQGNKVFSFNVEMEEGQVEKYMTKERHREMFTMIEIIERILKRREKMPAFHVMYPSRFFMERITNLVQIIFGWLETEGKCTGAVEFLRNYQPLRPKEERIMNLVQIIFGWLETEGKCTGAVEFLRNYQPLRPKEAMSKKKRNMKHHGMLPMSVQTGRYVVQGGAQKERGKLIGNAELSGKFDDAEKDIQELEQLLRCKVCLDSDACIVFLPCRHMSTCEYCEGFLHHCPVCRSFIEEAVKINEE